MSAHVRNAHAQSGHACCLRGGTAGWVLLGGCVGVVDDPLRGVGALALLPAKTAPSRLASAYADTGAQKGAAGSTIHPWRISPSLGIQAKYISSLSPTRQMRRSSMLLARPGPFAHMNTNVSKGDRRAGAGLQSAAQHGVLEVMGTTVLIDGVARTSPAKARRTAGEALWPREC